ncbi:FAD/NAD(P)-binding protein [Rhodococcus pyridinivorans]|uniref:FAD/NAD(P)-binding protein n=1 Tax=Rhodococcus pyridinivorans TaxID=103816 RepID=UPI0037C9F7D7
MIGSGPRGISLVERLVLHVAETVRVDVFDSHVVGAGRIWNPDQSPLLLMNSHVSGPTIFSGPRDDGPARAGAGPSLEQWMGRHYGVYRGYAPRAKYGEYLRDAFGSIVANAPANVSVGGYRETVWAVRRRPGGGYSVVTSSGREQIYDVVVLATGHPQPPAHPSTTTATSATRPTMVADSAANLPLDEVAPEDVVAMLGIGLSFHDVVALLTQGRGGVFVSDDTGELRYQPSGAEPTIVGVSRSGLPIPARGRNQKRPGSFIFAPRLCTTERMSGLRSLGQADFRTDVEPWIRAEMAATYCHAVIHAAVGPAQAATFLERVSAVDANDPEHWVYRSAERFTAVSELPALSALARPFNGRGFTSQVHWTRDLTAFLEHDLAHARGGNLANPLKAALDTLRDIRPSICAIVDDGGLTPRSHEEDFLGQFVPCYSLLVGGPPIRRVEELLALIRAGVVTVAGPGAEVVDDGSAVIVRSPAVPGSFVVDRVIDARVPKFDPVQDGSGLYRQLLADGLVRRFRHDGASGAVETGACEVDPRTNAAIGADGAVTPGLFILGIPTERQRWFTQIGARRVRTNGIFGRDAERVARAVTTSLTNQRMAIK